MQTTRTKTAPLLLSLLFCPLTVALASQELPPPDSKPLSLILKAVEEQKLGSIAEAEFDDGLWEVKVCAAATCQKLYIDPKSGAETRRKPTEPDDLPPADSVALSTITQSVESRQLGTITDVDFDYGLWKVKLLKDGRKIKLRIDPQTGKERG